MPRNFIQIHIPMVHLDKQVRWALQPRVQAPDTSCLQELAFIQILQAHVRQPAHQKSSALGMRVNAILPPVKPPGGGVHSPRVTTRFPN